MSKPNGDSIVHGLDSYTDLKTGKRYAYGTNEEVTDHLDEATKQVILNQLAPRQAGVVGNLADLQRIGGALVTESGKVADQVEPPPDRTAEEIEADRAKAEKVSDALDAAVADIDKAVSGDKVTTSKSTSSKK